MRAMKLCGVKDIQLLDIPEPPPIHAHEIRLGVKAVGLCGSDLHMYESGRTGAVAMPLTLGHEFMGEVLLVGDTARDGNGNPLQVGQRVAVEPNTPCYHCEQCEIGNPNLCVNHTFIGYAPTEGAMLEQLNVPARSCFPLPDSISDGGGALLETLGVAIHTLDLAKIKVANSVAVIGCGPVGLLILRLAKLAGASPLYAFDKFAWRVEKAREWGADEAWQVPDTDSIQAIHDATNGRGVDVVIEAAWADESVQQATEMCRPGGRVVITGISTTGEMQMNQSPARQKGLTLKFVRRMKHTYPRAIHLVEYGLVDVDDLISHHIPLEDVADAFVRNSAYEPGIHKIVITV